MRVTNKLTDSAVLKELGLRIARERVRAELTQAHLAHQAGISKRTLERLETGESTQMTNFLRILRALGLLAKVEILLPPSNAEPLEIVDNRGKERKRARSRPPKEKNAWKWGEDP